MAVLLLAHIVIALSSVAFSSFLAFRPSSRRFYVSYGLIAATLASGTWLTIASHARILNACLAGLLYVGVVTVLVAAAHQRFATNYIKPQ